MAQPAESQHDVGPPNHCVLRVLHHGPNLCFDQLNEPLIRQQRRHRVNSALNYHRVLVHLRANSFCGDYVAQIHLS